MKNIAKQRRKARDKRKKGLRKRYQGTDLRPRLCVFRSHKYTYVQLISDESGSVLGSASTREICEEGKSAQCCESAKRIGLKIAEIAKEQKLEQVVFDRNGYSYHGRIAAVAEGAREGGLSL